nr:RNA-directed RNA polymerase [Seli virus]
MEEILSEARSLCLNYIAQDERLSKQKLNFVSQLEPKFALIEGLKLLSRCIEIDSCEKNGCIHNNEDKSVETILIEHGMVCPGLPLMIPDGYKLIDNTLILLECFVRSSPASFEKKFDEDSRKLHMIKDDLQSVGINLVPLVDGRCTYETTLMPEWVNHKFRDLLFKLLEYANQDEKILEESEYYRLCESIKCIVDKRSGLDSLKVLKDSRSDHNENILRMCHAGINSSMSSEEVVLEVNRVYGEFRRDLENGTLKRFFKKSNPRELIEGFSNLYGPIDTESTAIDLCEEAVGCCPVMRFINGDIEGLSLTGGRSPVIDNLLSMLNKVKSLKLLNTRRRQLLHLDMLLLSAHVKHGATQPQMDQSIYWVGCCFISVNDRVVSLYSTKCEVEKQLRQKLSSNKRVGRRLTTPEMGKAFCELQKKFIEKLRKCLGLVGLSFSDYGLSHDLAIETEISLKDFLDYERMEDHPKMYYTKCENYRFKSSTNLGKDAFNHLSSLSLAITNSMKTSSIARLRQNQLGASRYQVVECKEAFCQTIKSKAGHFQLLYQKTGEGSRCFSVHGRAGHLASFYADPKRYFLPIFSQEVLGEMINVMCSWLKSCRDLKERHDDVKLLLRTLVLLLLTNPTKRNQKQVQNIRYLTMAIVSDFHHCKLMEKLKEDLITDAEFIVYKILRSLTRVIFSQEGNVMLTARFKFMLNVSYLCHLITKETPDRLTDQIKCFEKFFEPKNEFGFFLNPKEEITPEEKNVLYEQMEKFTNKAQNCQGSIPGINKRVFGLFVSSFNNGTLILKSEKSMSLLDPMTNSGCATALDLASNKSVVVNKMLNGERLLEYDFNKLMAASVSQLTESFLRKHRHKLSCEDYEYKVSKLISRIVLDDSNKTKKCRGEVTDDYALEDVLEGHDELEFFRDLKTRVESVVLSYSGEKTVKEVGSCDSNSKGLHHLQCVLGEDKQHIKKMIISEISYHLVEDFDINCISIEDMHYLCAQIEAHPSLGGIYFTPSFKEQCGIDEMTSNMCRKFFDDCDWFSCMKMILLQMNANTYAGKFRRAQRQQLNLKFDWDRLEDDARISERESNSESLSKALSLTKCLSAALKNLCFYSEESPTSYTSVGPDSGRLKFALSYKEQVGGNRELYIGDLRTKMFTRLVEDYFESFTSFFHGSCLNNEKEFENAILSMTINVRQGYLNYSMDHSKWGPMMCPFLFLVLLQNLKLSAEQYVKNGKDHISTLLAWHVHKMVEIPHSVVNAMMRSYIKDKLKLLKSTHLTPTEEFFRKSLSSGVVPSHITSLIDMGQGILHNTSDFYGLLSERFLNHCISIIFGEKPGSYTSSDDQITLFEIKISDMVDSEPDEVLMMLEFHNHLSGLLNKFISPKSVVGRFAAEFKSRFYVWGEEVPLLTKFVAAALHNIKCKEPHQLCETVDTILDQCVANGVPVSLVNTIQRRTISLLKYANSPIDPFMLNMYTDVKDWLDGSRGYRIQRLIEDLCPAETEAVRKLVRRLHNKLRNGELSEEFMVDLFNRDKSLVIQHLASILGVEEAFDNLSKLCWLNLNEKFPMRMVLRQKVVYPSSMTFQEEKLPTLIRTLQNKLSSKFTRGAQKLLSEAINKSAFQSCISSGFVGLCKTLGSRCVRDENKENTYIAKVLGDLGKCNCVTAIHNPKHGITLYHTGEEVLPNPRRGALGLLRPLMWDYICISLSNSFELGVWVLAEPELPKERMCANVSNVPRDPCDYVARKPEGVRLLEDRITLNHVIHSVRRLFPKMFEDQLLPFMSDQSSKMMKWNPRIKFLDLCVLIDIHSECLSLISHIVKFKRDEHYVVLLSELSSSHARKSTSLNDELVVSSKDICRNFLKQLYFESFVRDFIVTSRTIGNFTWFPHHSMMPNEDGAEVLGPFRTFVTKVVNKGIERPMYRTDVQSGFGWFSYQLGEAYCNVAQLVRSGLTSPRQFSRMVDFWNYLIDSTDGTMVISIQVDFTHNQSGGGVVRRFSLAFLMTCKVTAVETLSFLGCTYYYKGDVERRLLGECISILRTDPLFKSQDYPLLVRSDEFADYLTEPSVLGEGVGVELQGADRVLRGIQADDFERVGPEWEPVPICLSLGRLMEGKLVVQTLMVNIEDRDMRLFLSELIGTDKFGHALMELMKARYRTGEHLMNVNIERVTLDLELSKGLLLEPLRELPDWFKFKDVNLCYSNAKSTVMYETASGRYRLKGRSCEDWLSEAAVVDID